MNPLQAFLTRRVVNQGVRDDGLATRVQRSRVGQPEGAVRRAQRHAHTGQGLAVATIWGDLLWLDGGWPGCCHEHELIHLAGLAEILDQVEVASLLLYRVRRSASAPDKRSAIRHRTISALSQSLIRLLLHTPVYACMTGRERNL